MTGLKKDLEVLRKDGEIWNKNPSQSLSPFSTFERKIWTVINNPNIQITEDRS